MLDLRGPAVKVNWLLRTVTAVSLPGAAIGRRVARLAHFSIVERVVWAGEGRHFWRGQLHLRVVLTVAD